MKTTARDYHTATSYDRHNMSGHYLDWQNQPDVFKAYPGRETVALSRPEDAPEQSLRALYRELKETRTARDLNFNELSRVLFLGHALTAKARTGGGDFYFRSAASAGALYPNEVYLSAHAVGNLNQGIYHYGIGSSSLTLLRKGNFVRHVAAVQDLPASASPAATFFITAIFFRSAWKYRARAFRYVLMDAGHVLENLMLALTACGLKYDVDYNFNDSETGRLIGIDNKREVCVACVSVPAKGGVKDAFAGEIDPLPDAVLNASRVSGRETTYPEIESVFASGMQWSAPPGDATEMINTLGVSPGDWTAVSDAGALEDAVKYPGAVLSRRSKRNFIRQSISREVLMGFLDVLCHSAGPAGLGDHRPSLALSIGFLTRGVTDVADGYYLLDVANRRIGLVSEMSMIDRMTRICLDQEWLKNSSIHFLFMTNLDRLDAFWGPRGYRYAMIDAGRMGQAIYVCATSTGLGCCGIGALYDAEARALLGLNDQSALLYLVAVGPVKR